MKIKQFEALSSILGDKKNGNCLYFSRSRSSSLGVPQDPEVNSQHPHYMKKQLYLHVKHLLRIMNSIKPL